MACPAVCPYSNTSRYQPKRVRNAQHCSVFVLGGVSSSAQEGSECGLRVGDEDRYACRHQPRRVSQRKKALGRAAGGLVFISPGGFATRRRGPARRRSSRSSSAAQKGSQLEKLDVLVGVPLQSLSTQEGSQHLAARDRLHTNVVAISPGRFATRTASRGRRSHRRVVISPGGFETSTRPTPSLLSPSVGHQPRRVRNIVSNQLCPGSAGCSRHQPRRVRNVGQVVGWARPTAAVINPGGRWEHDPEDWGMSAEGFATPVATSSSGGRSRSSSAQEGSQRLQEGQPVALGADLHQPKRVRNQYMRAPGGGSRSVVISSGGFETGFRGGAGRRRPVVISPRGFATPRGT